MSTETRNLSDYSIDELTETIKASRPGSPVSTAATLELVKRSKQIQAQEKKEATAQKVIPDEVVVYRSEAKERVVVVVGGLKVRELLSTLDDDILDSFTIYGI